MTKDNKIKLNIGMIILGVILICLAFIIFILGIKIYNNNLEMIDLSQDWNCTIDSKKIEEKRNIKDKFDNLTENSEIVFTRKMPRNKSMIYPSICIDYMWCDIEVIYDGKSILKREYSPSFSPERENEIDMAGYKEGKEIKIKIRPRNIKCGNYIGNIYVLEGHEVVGYRIRNNLYSYIIGGLISIFGFIVSIITIFVKDKTKEVRKLFWIGCTFALLAVYLVSKKKLWIYFFRGELFTEIIMYLSIILLIPCVYKMHVYMYKDEKLMKIFKVGYILSMSLTGLALLYEDVLSKVMSADVAIGQILGGLIIMGIVLLLLDLKNTEGVDKVFDIGIFIIYGIIVCMVLVLLLVDYSAYIETFNDGVLMIGTIMLVCSLLYCSYRIKEYMDNITESKVLATLAYTDPLTGIMNRTKYEEVIEELKTIGKGLCTVVSFDLNNLKMINDQNGHEAGDEYIKSFSKVLRIGFGEEGFIARIGGDEFIAIIRDKYVNAESNIDMMQGLLKMTMKKHKEFETSFSYGIASRGRKDEIDIMDLIEKSDKEMYECKRRQKEEQKNK